MKISSKIIMFNYILSFLIAVITCLFPEISHADIGLGDVGNNITANAKGVAEAVQFIGYVGGVVCVVWGCFDLYKANDNQGGGTSYAGGFKKILIGVLLLAIGAIISVGSVTLFSTDEADGLTDLGL